MNDERLEKEVSQNLSEAFRVLLRSYVRKGEKEKAQKLAKLSEKNIKLWRTLKRKAEEAFLPPEVEDWVCQHGAIYTYRGKIFHLYDPSNRPSSALCSKSPDNRWSTDYRTQDLERIEEKRVCKKCRDLLGKKHG